MISDTSEYFWGYNPSDKNRQLHCFQDKKTKVEIVAHTKQEAADNLGVKISQLKQVKMKHNRN